VGEVSKQRSQVLVGGGERDGESESGFSAGKGSKGVQQCAQGRALTDAAGYDPPYGRSVFGASFPILGMRFSIVLLITPLDPRPVSLGGSE